MAETLAAKTTKLIAELEEPDLAGFNYKILCDPDATNNPINLITRVLADYKSNPLSTEAQTKLNTLLTRCQTAQTSIMAYRERFEELKTEISPDVANVSLLSSIEGVQNQLDVFVNEYGSIIETINDKLSLPMPKPSTGLNP